MLKHLVSVNAPRAVGAYSHAVKAGDMLYLSGQLPLDASTMQLVSGIEAQIRQAFKNAETLILESDAEMKDVIKVNVFLTDLSCFALVNSVMAEFFAVPYPARTAIGVAALPLGAEVEIEMIALVRS
ncbi:RidA family protein [Pseudomonas putida]|uniref:RidA family protein n=1 Tax=Pseudomonas TaxID=286 RepID=UPI00346621B2